MAVGTFPEVAEKATLEASLLVSVIVPVRNGGAAVRELIDALAGQTLGTERFEVIVADDGSSDGALAGLAGPDGWLRVSAGPPRNSYAARNRAVALARAPLFAFCDVDCRPEPDWLEAGLAAASGRELVVGCVRFTAPARPTVWSLLDIDFHLNQERAATRAGGATANLFVSRELFERVGGFDESLPNGGDWAFVRACAQSGAEPFYAPGAVVWHPTRDGRSFVRKVWKLHRCSGIRQGRAGERLGVRSAGFWFPPLEMVKRRRRDGKPLLLDRARLRENGVAVTRRDDARALPILYVLLPLLMRVARTYGWLEGRRPATRSDLPA